MNPLDLLKKVALVPQASAHEGMDHNDFDQHYRAILNQGGLTPEAAMQQAQATYHPQGAAPVTSPVAPFSQATFRDLAAPVAEPLVGSVNFVKDATIQGYGKLFDKIIGKKKPDEQYTTDEKQGDFGGNIERAKVGLTPIASANVSTTSKKELSDYVKFLGSYNHAEPDPNINARQAAIYTATKKMGGIPAQAFYQDIAKMAYTNPEVYLHAMHHNLAFPDLPPEERAQHLFAHLGAAFGSDLNYTPIGKYYANVLEQNPKDDKLKRPSRYSVFEVNVDGTKGTPQQIADKRLKEKGKLAIPDPVTLPPWKAIPLDFPAIPGSEKWTKKEKTDFINQKLMESMTEVAPPLSSLNGVEGHQH